MRSRRSNSLHLASLIVILLSGIALLGFDVPQVKAAGVVYVLPASQPIQQTGTNVTLTISFSGMDHFNKWDVYVKVDPNVLTPVKIDTSGSFLQTLTTTLADCVDGVGYGCTSSDGPGIAHSSLYSAWPPPIDSPWAGNLFSVTFKVKGSLGTFIHPYNDTITDSATGLPVVHSTVPGVFGQPGQFEFSSTPSLIVPLSGTNQSLVTVTSLYGFSGVVNLTATVPSLASYFLNVSLQPSQVRISPATPATFSVAVTSATSKGATPGNYQLNIVGASGPAYNSTSIPLFIPTVYLLYRVFYPLQANQGGTVSLQNTFQNEGALPIRITSVTLTADFGTFPLYSAHSNSITICGEGYTGTIDVINGQTSRPLNLTIPQTATPGNHTFTITVGWQYETTMLIYNNPVDIWCDTPPLALHRSMIVMQSSPQNPGQGPSGLSGPGWNLLSGMVVLIARNWAYALAAYLCLIAVALLLMVSKTRRKMPEPEVLSQDSGLPPPRVFFLTRLNWLST